MTWFCRHIFDCPLGPGALAHGWHLAPYPRLALALSAQVHALLGPG